MLRLNLASFGLKNAPRIWKDKFNSSAKNLGFRRLKYDECVYVYGNGDKKVFLFIYLDEILVVGMEQLVLQEKKVLLTLYSMRDLGKIYNFLGVKFDMQRKNAHIPQEFLTIFFLSIFVLSGCNPIEFPLLKRDIVNITEPTAVLFTDIKTYTAAIGALIFLAKSTRPDISVSVGLLARSSSNPSTQAWIGVKRIMQYLAGTMGYGLHYKLKDSSDRIILYCDADWAGYSVDRKSTIGFVILLYGCR